MLKHLLHHTYRSQFGWLWMFWFICIVQAIAGTVGIMNPWVQNFRLIFFFGQCLLAALAIFGGVQMHSMVGDNVFWKTRPLSRSELLRVNSTYVLGFVYLPLLASIFVGSMAAGFSGRQLFLAVLEWALYCGVGTAAISAVAAHTRNLGMGVGAGAGVFFFATTVGVGFNYLTNLFPDLRPAPGRPFYYQNSSLLVALMLLLGSAVFAFIWRQLRNSAIISAGSYGVAVFAFYLVAMYSPFGFLRPDVPHTENVKVSLINKQFTQDPESLSEQVLWSHFQASGIPTGTVLMPSTLYAQFQPEDRKEPKLMHTYHQSSHSRSGLDYFENSVSSPTAFRVLQARYPEDTVWTGRWRRHHQDTLPAGKRRRPTQGTPGRFSGYLRGEIVSLRQLADLPLKNGFTRLGEGYGVSVRLLTDEEGGLQFELREAVPELMYASRQEFRHNYYRASGIYLLYHPESREAILLDESGSSRDTASFLSNQAQIKLRFKVPRSQLREHLNGHQADDWATGLRLHVYHHRRVGKVSAQFADDQYRYQASHRRHISTWQQDSTVGFERLQQLKWPGTNDLAAAQKFAHEFVTQAPQNFYSNQSTLATKMLTDIGPEIVPFFLNEAPYTYAMGNIVLRRALQRLATREHIPALKKALLRDPELALLVQSKRWGKECAPTLAKLLKNRERPLPASALTVIANHATPEQFADLEWHSTRCKNGQDALFRSLRKLDGFPYRQTVHEAWVLARLQFVSEINLAVFAAELGELDALHALIRQMNSSTSEARDRRAFEILRPKLEAKGDDKALRKWLLDHANEIRFDEDRDKYVI